MRRFFGLLLVDLLLIGLATNFALLLRDNLEISPIRFLELVPYTLGTMAVAAPLFSLLRFNYTSWHFGSLGEYLRISASVMVTVLLSVVLGFVIYRLEGVPRSLPLLQAILIIFALIGARVTVRQCYFMMARQDGPATVTAFRQEFEQDTVLVVGLNSVAELFLKAAAEFSPSRMRIVGVLCRKDEHFGRYLGRHSVLGTPEELETVLRDLDVHGISVDRIIVTTAPNKLSKQAQNVLARIEKTTSIRLEFIAELIGFEPMGKNHELADRQIDASLTDTARRSFPNLDTRDFAEVAQNRYWRIKRIFDFTVAACLIALTLPLALAVALLLALDVGFPLMFWQQRPGLFGRPFKICKFRTMSGAHNSAGERVPDEQRLSACGNFLRRARLDELPQLFNILIGEMSFVGPRPLLPIDQAANGTTRLYVRPGLTGWAQVKGGRTISPEDKYMLDVWYIRNATLLLDLEIALRTVPMVLFGERADPNAIAKAWAETRGAEAARDVAGVGSLKNAATVL